MTLRSEPYYRSVVAAVLTAFHLLRLRVQVQGGEHLPAEGGAVLAVTHFGYVDFACLGAASWWQHRRPVRFLATSAAFRHRLAGPLMRGMGHVPVEAAKGRDAYQPAIEALERGELLGVFPEGRVSRDWQLGPFKTGAVRLAARAQVPLIPVVVWGAHRVLTGGRRPRWRDAVGVPVTVLIGAPLVLPERAHQGTAELKAAMTLLLAAAQASYPAGPAGEGDQWWQPAGPPGGAPAAPA